MRGEHKVVVELGRAPLLPPPPLKGVVAEAVSLKVKYLALRVKGQLEGNKSEARKESTDSSCCFSVILFVTYISITNLSLPCACLLFSV